MSIYRCFFHTVNNKDDLHWNISNPYFWIWWFSFLWLTLCCSSTLSDEVPAGEEGLAVEVEGRVWWPQGVAAVMNAVDCSLEHLAGDGEAGQRDRAGRLDFVNRQCVGYLGAKVKLRWCWGCLSRRRPLPGQSPPKWSFCPLQQQRPGKPRLFSSESRSGWCHDDSASRRRRSSAWSSERNLGGWESTLPGGEERLRLPWWSCKDHKRQTWSVPAAAELDAVWIWGTIEFHFRLLFKRWIFTVKICQQTAAKKSMFPNRLSLWWKHGSEAKDKSDYYQLITKKMNFKENDQNCVWLTVVNNDTLKMSLFTTVTKTPSCFWRKNTKSDRVSTANIWQNNWTVTDQQDRNSFGVNNSWSLMKMFWFFWQINSFIRKHFCHVISKLICHFFININYYLLCKSSCVLLKSYFKVILS